MKSEWQTKVTLCYVRSALLFCRCKQRTRCRRWWPVHNKGPATFSSLFVVVVKNDIVHTIIHKSRAVWIFLFWFLRFTFFFLLLVYLIGFLLFFLCFPFYKTCTTATSLSRLLGFQGEWKHHHMPVKISLSKNLRTLHTRTTYTSINWTAQNHIYSLKTTVACHFY